MLALRAHVLSSNHGHASQKHMAISDRRTHFLREAGVALQQRPGWFGRRLVGGRVALFVAPVVLRGGGELHKRQQAYARVDPLILNL